MNADQFLAAMQADQERFAGYSAIERAVGSGRLIPYPPPEDLEPAFQLPERVTQRILRRRLSSWQASMGPIKHGWG